MNQKLKGPHLRLQTTYALYVPQKKTILIIPFTLSKIKYVGGNRVMASETFCYVQSCHAHLLFHSKPIFQLKYLNLKIVYKYFLCRCLKVCKTYIGKINGSKNRHMAKLIRGLILIYKKDIPRKTIAKIISCIFCFIYH